MNIISKSRCALLPALAGFLLGACAQTAPIVAPASTARTPEISVETLKAVTQELSSDAYEGRAPGTSGEAKSIAYVAQQMAAAGLQPGNKGSWYQDVPIVEISADPASFAFSVAGATAPVKFAYKTDFVGATYRQLERIDVRDSELVFVGYGINAPERGWNDYAGIDVRGKTVVILVNDPDYAMQTLDGPFGGRAMTYYGRWTYKFEEAARQGAAAALIVHDTYPAAYPWGVVVSSWTGPQVQIDLASKGMDQTMFNGWLSNEAATRLLKTAGKDLAQLSAAAKEKSFRAVPLGLKANIALANSLKRAQSKNVVGILPGRTRPDDYVLYSAHWDHLGRCEPVNGDDICNGALDNASGTAGLIALAQAHAKAGPAGRSIVFLAVTAEESGLLGSKHYAENPIFPLARTVGGINMDGLNVLGRSRDIVVVGPGKSELEGILERNAKDQDRILVPEPTPEKGFYYRSDHFSFAKQGVPMIYFDSGEDLRVGGKAAGHAAAEDYTNNRYHKPQDEYNAAWNWDGAVEDLTLNYQIGRELATGAAWPNWYPTAEFRAIRDKSRQGQ